MKSSVTLAGHPVHPVLIVYPLGLFSTSLVFDAMARVGGNSVWAAVAFYLIGAGIIGGLLAAVVGAVDWLGIPRGTRAMRIGLYHGLGNVVVVLIFSLSWLLRRPDPHAVETLPFALSLMAFGLTLVAAWLGGELVTRLGVGVDEGAHLNASNSLSRRDTPEGARHRDASGVVAGRRG
jgi:uncharacterized membrane protein